MYKGSLNIVYLGIKAIVAAYMQYLLMMRYAIFGWYLLVSSKRRPCHEPFATTYRHGVDSWLTE